MPLVKITHEGAGLHLHRAGEAECIGGLVYTVTKSNFITGVVINIDGGMAAGYNLTQHENTFIDRFFVLQFAGLKSTKFKKNENYSRFISN